MKHGDEWGDPAQCENGDNCGYCHTRTEQQFHPEVNFKQFVKEKYLVIVLEFLFFFLFGKVMYVFIENEKNIIKNTV